jgi:calcineurin-like phosphoesterase
VKPLTVLVVGDIFGEPGRRAAISLVPRLRVEHDVDLVVANVENAAAGYGVTPAIAQGLLRSGMDVLTSRNPVWDQKEILG